MNKKWINIERCMLCKNTSGKNLGRLNLDSYLFCGKIIELPSCAIHLIECENCGLVYKDCLPSIPFLSEIFQELASNTWNDSYNYTVEIELLRELLDKEIEKLSLLDVGGSNGSFIKALRSAGNVGKLSILDLDVYHDINTIITGEHIIGLIDQRDLCINLDYDIVTLFDVLEHVYEPEIAFNNMKNLINDSGIIIIETGNSDFVNENIRDWWYAKLFEHHVFWNAKSLSYAANKSGLIVLRTDRKCNKQRLALPYIKRMIIRNLWKVRNISAAKVLMKKFTHINLDLIGDVNDEDHIRVVLTSAQRLSEPNEV